MHIPVDFVPNEASDGSVKKYIVAQRNNNGSGEIFGLRNFLQLKY